MAEPELPHGEAEWVQGQPPDRARRAHQQRVTTALAAAALAVAVVAAILVLVSRPAARPAAAVPAAAVATRDHTAHLVDQLARAEAKQATCRALAKVVLVAARNLDRNFEVHHSAHARMMGHDLAGRPVPEISRAERNRIWRVTLGARARTSPVFRAADTEHTKAGCS